MTAMNFALQGLTQEPSYISVCQDQNCLAPAYRNVSEASTNPSRLWTRKMAPYKFEKGSLTQPYCPYHFYELRRHFAARAKEVIPRRAGNVFLFSWQQPRTASIWSLRVFVADIEIPQKLPIQGRPRQHRTKES